MALYQSLVWKPVHGDIRCSRTRWVVLRWPGPSMAQAAELVPSCAPADWAERMARELLSRQYADGSWTNRYTDAREDDPLVGTFQAGLALAICRRQFAGSTFRER